MVSKVYPPNLFVLNQEFTHDGFLCFNARPPTSLFSLSQLKNNKKAPKTPDPHHHHAPKKSASQNNKKGVLCVVCDCKWRRNENKHTANQGVHSDKQARIV